MNNGNINSKLDVFVSDIFEGTFSHISSQDLIFEENVKMNCYYCGRYNYNWRCPPRLPNVDFKKMVREYDNALLLWNEWKTDNREEYDSIRTESSLVIHRTLLKVEKWLWNHNYINAISFGAGSCKLCKDGCGKDRCNNPYSARSPIEATGINIIKSMKKIGIDIRFDPEVLIRVGLVLY